MNTKILLVDDEPNVLSGYTRQLRKQFDLETALGGKLGLEAVNSHGPFAVIVSDMRMPEMSGVEFLARVRQIAPDTVRMMLTGNSDQETAIRAINQGNIFRFLTKPCSSESMADALRAGLEQHRLITAEKELLELTLRGSIQVLSEVLSLVSPVAFGRATRVQRLVRSIASYLELPDVWQIEVAAMLSQIGCVTIPESILHRAYSGEALAADEKSMFEHHPRIGESLIAKIPRMEPVARIIGSQEKRFHGHEVSMDDLKSEVIPLGARILKVALDFESLESNGYTKIQAVECLSSRNGWYDPRVLDALQAIALEETGWSRQILPIQNLRPGMILEEDVRNSKGQLLIRKGLEITDLVIQLLHNLASGNSSESIAVRVPSNS